MEIKVGDIIASGLVFKDIKQKQMAIDLGIQYTTFNNYVGNIREPDFATLIRIFTYLDVDLNEVFKHHVNHDNYKITKDEAQLLKLYRSIPKEFQKNAIAINENLATAFIKKP